MEHLASLRPPPVGHVRSRGASERGRPCLADLPLVVATGKGIKVRMQNVERMAQVRVDVGSESGVVDAIGAQDFREISDAAAAAGEPQPQIVIFYAVDAQIL